ncbi:pyrroline-5-carboxylate reductase [Nocardioides luteus]|uniref:Pyrroline-5-carboxylate reductase n=2 Tax=Nocardioides luteus TaxID=1844 RepID=A0ABQ5SSX0_9ACTN|nr:pyrroline-5-carboxylate reductase [Nocardioides luteus]GLJ66301.1 pyrroline-5-carboxylate reductase [Nocardioides luteus]
MLGSLGGIFLQVIGSDRLASMTIAIIGAGNMGGAVLAGLLEAGRDPQSVIVVEAREEQAAALRDKHGIRTLSAEEAVAQSDVVVLGVKPYGVVPVLESIASSLREGTTVVSLAAGVPTSAMEPAVPDGVSVVRVMPNTPALVGAGMSAVAGGANATPEAVETAADLMNAVGTVITVPESQIDAVTAISGSGPAYVFMIAEAWIEAGVHLGLTRDDATTLVIETLTGSAELLRSGTHPALLREQVTSPGGTTAAALGALERNGLRAAFLEATRAAYVRSQELS